MVIVGAMPLSLPLNYIFASMWSWFLNTGINLILILLIGMLVPRIGRLVMRLVRHRVESDIDEESGKNKLAFAGVGLYIAQIIAFFFLIVAFMQQIGFSLAGAAIPATVASAAVGFGAQSIIADFLAGFLILTEKQFGVGDWVRFEGSGVDVEGTVVEVTMRATTIRTISHQTVIIPNSAAKVCINHSKEWSRAVIVIPVPMLGSDNVNDVIRRSEEATRRAIAQDDVAPVVIGELDVHPSVDVQPPTVVGMPWLVTMRFMVQVTAGNQWLVERAVRTRIIEEFWDEYGSATTTSGTFVDRLALDEHPLDNPVESLDSSTQQPSRAYTRKPVFDVPVDSLDAETTAINMGAGGALATGKQTAAETADITGDGDIQPTSEGTHPNRPDVSMSVIPEETTIESADEAVTVDKDTAAGGSGRLPGLFRTDSYEKSWQKVLSIGGRTRMSTSLMLLGLLVLLLIKLFTIEPPEDWEPRGFSPANDEETAVTTPADPEPEVTPEESLPVESPTPNMETTPSEAPGQLNEQGETITSEPTSPNTSEPTPTTQSPTATTPAGTPTQSPPTPTTAEPVETALQDPLGTGAGA